MAGLVMTSHTAILRELLDAVEFLRSILHGEPDAFPDARERLNRAIADAEDALEQADAH